MTTNFGPDDSQLATLASLDPDAPVAALNLFQFNERAQYSPADEEYGTEAANVSGQEAFSRYAAAAGQVLADLGGRVVFSTTVEQVMIGPSDPPWHAAAIMFFPTRKAFIQMTMNPDFRAASRHRKAGLANHYQAHLDGTPWMCPPP
ncbi:MAG: DUF1330 domain-containing protein [Acidobacteria bacterium]|nr:DUF1330 domain-containing protein [Acidobacteriota bacterium]